MRDVAVAWLGRVKQLRTTNGGSGFANPSRRFAVALLAGALGIATAASATAQTTQERPNPQDYRKAFTVFPSVFIEHGRKACWSHEYREQGGEWTRTSETMSSREMSEKIRDAQRDSNVGGVEVSRSNGETYISFNLQAAAHGESVPAHSLP